MKYLNIDHLFTSFSSERRWLCLCVVSLLGYFAISNICSHSSVFHPYHDDSNRHVEPLYFCPHLSEDFIQCLTYDSQDANTIRLIRVEYVISGAL